MGCCVACVCACMFCASFLRLSSCVIVKKLLVRPHRSLDSHDSCYMNLCGICLCSRLSETIQVDESHFVLLVPVLAA